MASEPRVADDPRLVAFGTALVAARTERGWTLDDHANRSGLSRRTISYLEGGLINPRLLTVVALTHALEIDSSRLLEPVREIFAQARD